MSVPLVLLGALALFGGMLKIPLDSVFPALFNHDHTFDLVSFVTGAMPLIGLLIAVPFYLTGAFSAQRLAGSGLANQLQMLCLNGWGMDALYDTLVVRPFKTLTELNKNDAVDGAYSAIALLSRRGHLWISASQTGHIRWYASSMVLGAVVIIAIGWLS